MNHTDTNTIRIIPCDDRCMFAKGDDCDCQCGGKNHKQGGRLTAAQRAIARTPAGRRIGTLTPGTPLFQAAQEMADMYEGGGYTRRDIAEQFGISAPTVRRYIRQYDLTLEALELTAQAA